MLLLVLILVVVAFGLLVVALLTGSVLWAWVSVGVSVVAAIVLLIDWLQRRSAVKAGAAPAVGSPSRPLPAANLDPATEILPVFPASGRGGSGSGGPAEDRTDRVPDAHQTVAMPVIQPSGSPVGPSGAEDTVTSSGGLSSRSVTSDGGDRSSSTAAGHGADDITRTMSGAAVDASEGTVSISKGFMPQGPDTSSPVSEKAVSEDPGSSVPSGSSVSAGSTSAGSTSAGSTSAGSTSAGSTSSGSTSSGSTSAGSTSSGSTSSGSTSSGSTSESMPPGGTSSGGPASADPNDTAAEVAGSSGVGGSAAATTLPSTGGGSAHKQEAATGAEKAGAEKAGAAGAASEPSRAPGRPDDGEPGGTAVPPDAPGSAYPAARGSAAAEPAPSSEQTIVTTLPAVAPTGSGSRPDPASGSADTQQADVSRSDVSNTDASKADGPKADGPKADLAKADGPKVDGPKVDTHAGSTSDVEKTVTVQARPPSTPAERPPAAEPSPEHVSDAVRPPVVPAAERNPAPGDASAPPTAVQDPPTRQDDGDLFAAAAVVGDGPGAGAHEIPAPLGEAPEEQRDPAVAETVSGLDDEVVVVDEQPRYHVESCRALASAAVIPLPVREAVELGFTPCGWCSPDRTLSGRHRTAAR